MTQAIFKISTPKFAQLSFVKSLRLIINLKEFVNKTCGPWLNPLPSTLLK